MLILESFQAGLSWECILNKREAFRRAFDGFDLEKVCAYGEEKLAALGQDPGIVRNKLEDPRRREQRPDLPGPSGRSGGALTATSGTGRGGKRSLRRAGSARSCRTPSRRT